MVFRIRARNLAVFAKSFWFSSWITKYEFSKYVLKAFRHLSFFFSFFLVQICQKQLGEPWRKTVSSLWSVRMRLEFSFFPKIRCGDNGRNNSADNSHQCWDLLANNVAPVCPRLNVWPDSSLTKQHETKCNGLCKRTQHVISSNVGKWVRLHEA